MAESVPAWDGTSPPGIVQWLMREQCFLGVAKRRVGSEGPEALEALSYDLAPGESVCLAHYVELQDLQGTILQKLVLFSPIRNVSCCLLGNSRWVALILIWGWGGLCQ